MKIPVNDTLSMAVSAVRYTCCHQGELVFGAFHTTELND